PEAGSAPPGHVTDRRPERGERRQQLGPVGLGAAGVDESRDVQMLERSGGVERGSTGARLPLHDVPREVAEERDHARASAGLRTSSPAIAVRAKARAKLGRDAPPQGSEWGSV